MRCPVLKSVWLDQTPFVAASGRSTRLEQKKTRKLKLEVGLYAESWIWLFYIEASQASLVAPPDGEIGLWGLQDGSLSYGPRLHTHISANPIILVQ